VLLLALIFDYHYYEFGVIDRESAVCVLPQKEVAGAIGCHQSSLLNWEKGRAEPELRFLPAIFRSSATIPGPEATP
jgi:hypothetical protein